MAVEDNESCSSRTFDSSPAHMSQQHRHKLEVCLKDFDNEEANLPGFDDVLWTHFNRLLARYAMDVNVERGRRHSYSQKTIATGS